MRGGVHRSGHHPVGEAELDHHRAEVGDVDHDVAGGLEVDALVRAPLVVLLREPLAQLLVVRAEQPGCGDVDAEVGSLGADDHRVAEQGQVGDVAAKQDVGGAQDPLLLPLRQDDVAAVGDRVVEDLVLEHQRRHDRGARHLETAHQLLAVDVLGEEGQRRRDLARRVLVQPAAAVGQRGRGGVGAEVGGDHRQRHLEPVQQPTHLLGQLEPAVEDDAGDLREAGRLVRREDAEDHLGTVAGRDDERTVEEPVQHVGQGHRRDHEAGDLARQLALVAAHQAAVAGRHQVTHRGRTEQGLLGQGEGRHAVAPQRRRRPLGGRGVHPVGDDGEERRVVGSELGLRHRGCRAQLVDAPPLAVEDQQDRRAEVGGDPGVEGELRRCADVGVVAADDHHGVALLRDLVVARDDAVHRTVGVGVHVVVAHAGALVVRQGDGVVRDEQVEDVVVDVARRRLGTDHRPEDRHPRHAARQLLQHPERHRGLAGEPLDPGHVHAACHGPSLATGLGAWRPVRSSGLGHTEDRLAPTRGEPCPTPPWRAASHPPAPSASSSTSATPSSRRARRTTLAA